MKNFECQILIKSQDSKDSFKVVVHDDIEKGVLSYEEDNTITTYDYKNDIFTRENDDMKIKYHFCLNKITENKILIKNINSEVTINVLTKQIEKNKDYIKIIYEIEDNKFTYMIKRR